MAALQITTRILLYQRKGVTSAMLDHLHFESDDDTLDGAVGLRPRSISDDEILKFEKYIKEIFGAVGMDLDTPATRETPHRFMRALLDMTEGYEGDPKLLKVFETECRGEPDCHLAQVIEGPIQFYSLCEHHALPFFGNAYVGYIAHEHIIGLSKLTRLVRLYAKRFAVQERIGQQIADALEAMLKPHAVGVYLEANHLCMQMRGVREAAPMTRSMVWRGYYATDPALRDDFMVAAGLHR
ncbi:MAG: GTP cyclohydrolase I [Chloroflexota bacterium]|nr:MAG: GTP cyclohydrolase I [Chloroflexota bacterium]